MKKIHIVKRHGEKEQFDERKVYGSVYAACLSAHLSEKQCEHLAEKVCKDLTDWIDDKQAVDSKEIFGQVHGILEKYHADAAFLYRTHRDIS